MPASLVPALDAVLAAGNRTTRTIEWLDPDFRRVARLGLSCDDILTITEYAGSLYERSGVALDTFGTSQLAGRYREKFWGDSLSPRWAVSGAGTVTLPSGTSGGKVFAGHAQLSTGAINGQFASLHFGGIDTIEPALRVRFITGVGFTSPTIYRAYWGLLQTAFDPAADPAAANHCCLLRSIPGQTIKLLTSDGGALNIADTGEANYTDGVDDWVLAIDGSAYVPSQYPQAEVRVYHKGLLKATVTANLPVAALQPFFAIGTTGAFDRLMQVSSVDVFNG